MTGGGYYSRAEILVIFFLIRYLALNNMPQNSLLF